MIDKIIRIINERLKGGVLWTLRQFSTNCA
jgi:hypothetical protein